MQIVTWKEIDDKVLRSLPLNKADAVAHSQWISLINYDKITRLIACVSLVTGLPMSYTIHFGSAC